jgi:bifunctional N-acetylglucosamine-1-phosphate-uridyltransferase/glucosamine-1-phosphate-acetyltransferase GlmU-like protein
MKKSFATIIGMVLLAWTFNTSSALAKDKVVTIKGEAKCAMCMLHEADACKTVIQTQNHGKTETYYLAENDVSKSFHDDVCHGAKQVVAKGTLAEVGGKKTLTLTKLEVAKK